MARKKNKTPSETPAIDTTTIPWHVDYHKAGNYKPEIEPETTEAND